MKFEFQNPELARVTYHHNQSARKARNLKLGCPGDWKQGSVRLLYVLRSEELVICSDKNLEFSKMLDWPDLINKVRR